MTILKDEINAAGRDLLSLAKWRLVIIAGLAVVGLGLNKELSDEKHGYLLLFIVPFVSLYVDLWRYQRVTNLHSIAKYLREYQGADLEQCELRDYELAVERSRNVAGLKSSFERYAELIASLVISIILPLMAYLKFPQTPLMLLIVPAVGWALIVVFFIAHRRNIKRIRALKP